MVLSERSWNLWSLDSPKKAKQAASSVLQTPQLVHAFFRGRGCHPWWQIASIFPNRVKNGSKVYGNNSGVPSVTRYRNRNACIHTYLCIYIYRYVYTDAFIALLPKMIGYCNYAWDGRFVLFKLSHIYSLAYGTYRYMHLLGSMLSKVYLSVFQSV